MFTKITQYVQTIFKNQYSAMIAGALIAHLGMLIIIVNIFNLSYGIGLLLFWTYIWMVDCSKKQELSGLAQALICGPVGWVLSPASLNPVSLRKSYELGAKKSSFFWTKGCAFALSISQAFHTVRSYLMQLGALKPEGAATTQKASHTASEQEGSQTTTAEEAPSTVQESVKE